MQLYLQAVRSLYNAAATVGNDLADNLDDKDTGNPNTTRQYDLLSAEIRRSHLQLAGNEGIVSLSNNYTDTSIKRLDDNISIHRRIADQIKQRDTAKEEFEYYSKKVTELNEEMKKLESKGKTKPADAEKLQRNNSKLVETKARYVSLNGTILEEVKLAYDDRITLFGPIASEFVTFEKLALKTYTEAIESIPEVSGGGAGASAVRRPPSIPQDNLRQASNVSTGSSYNPQVSDPFASSAAPVQNRSPPPYSGGSVDHSRTNSSHYPTAPAKQENPFGDLE